MRSKKGLTEADWAMSMGIFLLYLAWFFIVLKPTFSPDTKESLPFDDLKKEFQNEASWSVNKTPLIIRSNITGINEPIIVAFPYDSLEQQYSIDGVYTDIEEGKLFFLADLYKRVDQSTQLYYLLHSTSNYTQPSMESDLVSSEERTSTGDILVTYNRGIVQQGFFKDSVRILDYSIKADGSDMDTSQSTHMSNKLLAKHKIITPQMNHSSYIIQNNSRIYNFFNSNTEKYVSVGLRIDAYPYYYIDENTGGTIKYNESQCDIFTTDYIDLFDNAYGLAFIFDEDVSLELCHKNNLSVTASFYADGEFGYSLMFHDRQADMAKMTQPYYLIFGAEEVLTGLSSEKLFYLEDKNYSTVKSNWSYDYDFNITLMNTTNNPIFSFGAKPTKYSVIAGQTYNHHRLYANGSMEKVSVNMLSW